MFALIHLGLKDERVMKNALQLSNAPRLWIFHIGAEKTGTTSIQAFLGENRALLLNQGILYPESPGKRNHLRLAAWAADDDRPLVKSLFDAQKSHQTLPALRDSIRAELSAELQNRLGGGSASPVRAVVFSAEHLHSQLKTVEEVSRLRSLLPDDAQVKIIFYIRRQDRAEFSLHSTAVKAGNSPISFAFSERERISYRFDYYAAYQIWSSVFGRDALSVRLFSPGEFDGGDLLTDFCNAAGIQWSDEFIRPRRENPSLSANGAFVQEQFNRLLAEESIDIRSDSVKAVRKLIEQQFLGRPGLPAREAAQRFYERFSGINEKLRQAAFSERSRPLFDDDFSEYPLQAVAAENQISHEEITQDLLRVLLKQMGSQTDT